MSDGKATHDHVLSTGDNGYVFSGVTAFKMGERSMAGLNTFRTAIAKGTAGPTTSWPSRTRRAGPRT